LLIAKKDLDIFVRDRMAVMWALLFPLLMMFMFNMISGGFGVGTVAGRLNVALATEEAAGGISHEVIAGVRGAGSGGAEAAEGFQVTVVDPDAAREDVKQGKLDGFLLFPADFTTKLLAGEPARLVVVVDPQATNTRMALTGIARVVAAEATAERVLWEAATEQGAPLAEPSPGAAPLITLEAEQVGPMVPKAAGNYGVPGYLTMFIFFAAAMGTSEIARERANQTLDRLMTVSTSRGVLVLGKFLGLISRGLVQIVVFWTVGVLAFHADFGAAPLTLLAVALLMVLASAAAGILLATVARTEAAAIGLGVLVSMVLAPLGGCWWPTSLMPPWMQAVGRFTPHFWANEAMNKLMLFGARPVDVWLNLVVLAGFAAVFTALGVARSLAAER
jgi:ABC-2 type transport system permease protein